MPKKSSDAAGKKGTKKDETAPKESKKSKKAARQAAEAERARAVESMLAPASDDEAAMPQNEKTSSLSSFLFCRDDDPHIFALSTPTSGATHREKPRE